RELGTERLGIVYRLIAGKGDRAQPVAVTLFDGQSDVDPLALARAEGDQREAGLIVQTGDRLADIGGVVALVVIGLANALGVFFELAGVVGLGEQVLEEDGM